MLALPSLEFVAGSYPGGSSSALPSSLSATQPLQLPLSILRHAAAQGEVGGGVAVEQAAALVLGAPGHRAVRQRLREQHLQSNASYL